VECPSANDETAQKVSRTCCLQTGKSLGIRKLGRNSDVHVINIQLFKTGKHADIQNFKQNFHSRVFNRVAGYNTRTSRALRRENCIKIKVCWKDLVLSMGWKKVSTTTDTSSTFRRDLHQNNEGPQMVSERRYRKRRNALTLCMMEDLLQAENFQSLLNIHATRRGSRANVE